MWKWTIKNNSEAILKEYYWGYYDIVERRVKLKTSLHREILIDFADNTGLFNYFKWFGTIWTYFVFFKNWR